MDPASFDLMRWQNLAANACYLILAASYLVTNMYWLRVLAIVALGLEAVYFVFGAESPLWVGIAWNFVFVAINVVQLTFLYRERWQVRFSDQERLLHQGLFAEFGPVEFNRLLRSGAWREIYEGTVLTKEAHIVQELMVVIKGLAKVEVAGETVALLQPGAFIGEMSLLTGEPASATVTALVDGRIFAISQERLGALLEKDVGIKTAIHRVIGRDLVTKLKSSWQPIA